MKLPIRISNYRPISLLPIFSKILENDIHLRVGNFLEEQKIISPEQHDFLKDKSNNIATYDFVLRSIQSYLFEKLSYRKQKVSVDNKNGL